MGQGRCCRQPAHGPCQRRPSAGPSGYRCGCSRPRPHLSVSPAAPAAAAAAAALLAATRVVAKVRVHRLRPHHGARHGRRGQLPHAHVAVHAGREDVAALRRRKHQRAAELPRGCLPWLPPRPRRARQPAPRCAQIRPVLAEARLASSPPASPHTEGWRTRGRRARSAASACTAPTRRPRSARRVK